MISTRGQYSFEVIEGYLATSSTNYPEIKTDVPCGITFLPLGYGARMGGDPDPIPVLFVQNEEIRKLTKIPIRF